MKKVNLLIVSSLLFSTGVGLVGCQVETQKPIPDADKEPVTSNPVKLETPTNFTVVRTENVWTVTFGTVQNASSYLLDIKTDTEILFDDIAVTSGYSLEPIERTGNYIFELSATSEDTEKYLASDVATFEYNVEVLDKKAIEETQYTGILEQGKPVGEFIIDYATGDKFTGLLKDDFTRNKGKHQYANNMYYEGEFDNDLFDGKGLFTWSTTGNHKDGNTYEGEFKAGGFLDCIGTYTTSANYTRPIDYSGIYNFTGKMGSVFGECGKVGTTGQGEFQYGNNSIYKGDLYVQAPWVFLRKGHGFNKWIIPQTSEWITGGNNTLYIYGFEGEFDSINHAWIFGDGIWYFVDAEGEPVSYAKGTWDAGVRLGNAKGELKVRDEFKNAKEIVF